MRSRLTIVAFFLGIAVLTGQQQNTIVNCPPGTMPQSVVDAAAGKSTTVCTQTTPPVAAPTISSFTANPTQVQGGSATQLSWTLAGGPPESQFITPGDIAVPAAQRTHSVTVTAATTFVLTVVNAGGKATASVPVTVTVPPTQNNTARLDNAAAHPSGADPKQPIKPGGQTKMDWYSSGGNPLTIHVEPPTSPHLMPAVSARNMMVTAESTVGPQLWRVVYNRGLKNTSGGSIETWKHVTITTSGSAEPNPPPNVNCTGAWKREMAISETACQSNGTKVVTYREKFETTVQASGTGTCEAANGATREVPVTEKCTFTPPPTTGDKAIWGNVDPTILGSCSAATHDKYALDIGYPVRFRTYHRQVDPSGCTYGHEHGMDPALMRNAEIASEPVVFGLVGWSHKTPQEPEGHQEAHEGFKVFIANPGDVNDEHRINRVFSRSVFHMGTGGPLRFSLRHHSAMIRLIHPEFGLKAFTQLMMDTGGTATVCDPRVGAPTKDVMQLNSPCKLNSGYEIWGTFQIVRNAAGKEVYRAIATPAVFDPITVKDPRDPTALVYAWDPRMTASKAFPENDWTGNRGCDRESYAQPGNWYNADGQTIYYTNAMGEPVASNAPGALAQEISRSDNVGSPATNDGLKQFKNRINFCGNRAQLSLKN